MISVLMEAFVYKVKIQPLIVNACPPFKERIANRFLVQQNIISRSRGPSLLQERKFEVNAMMDFMVHQFEFVILVGGAGLKGAAKVYF